MVTLDFGNSLVGGHRPVIDEMSERFPATLELVIPASILALFIGVIGGTFAAAKRKSARDYGLRIYSVVIYSLPIFWFGLMLQLLFGVVLNWLPISGRIDPVIGTSLEHVTNLYFIDALISGNWPALASVAIHLVLPTFTLGLILSGVFVRMTRINVIETLQTDYIAAARARGIREHVVVYKHALQNAMIPVITLIGLAGGHPVGRSGVDRDHLLLAWHGQLPGAAYLCPRLHSRAECDHDVRPAGGRHQSGS